MPETEYSGWDASAYQWLATIGAVVVLAFHWVLGGVVPFAENGAIAGILAAFAVAIQASAWVRRHRVELFEVLATIVALWSVRVAAAGEFEGDPTLAMLMGLFAISLVIRRVVRLAVFHAAALTALAVALALATPQEHFDRATLWVVSGVIAVVSLVAGRARERAVERAVELARVVSRVPNGVVVTDPAGHVRWANLGFSTLSGRAVPAAVGRCVWDLLDVPPSDPVAVERLKEAIRTAHDTRQVQLAHLLPDGSPRWVAVDLTPTVDPTGRLDGWIVVETDIAEARAYTDQLLLERQEAERALHDAEERLRQSQKLEAIGRLAGGVAHDFNNLLAVILGYTTLLERDPTGPRAKPALLEIHKAAERAATLTKQLLAFSRQQVLAPRVLQLGDVVRGAEGMLRRVIGEDVELLVETRERLHTRADPNQVEQVLLNLVVNARDAMPHGGRLRIETDDAALDEAYARVHPDVTPGEYVVLAVSDTGMGMTPEVRERIFEPFFTTKKVGEGTGLGLATVHGIVKQSGGHVSCYSEPGQGATFRVYLPATHAETSVVAPPAEKPALSGTETVLLVEDDAQVRHVAADVLQAHGYDVLAAGGHEEALALLASHPGPVHLLLTDVVMAGMGGPQLAARIRELRPSIGVLYTSGYTRNAIVDRGGELAAGVDLLPKPFTAEALARKVREVLDA
jgi:two-component system cell cycle sensor histidine kinase/response regulator CckA